MIYLDYSIQSRFMIPKVPLSMHLLPSTSSNSIDTALNPDDRMSVMLFLRPIFTGILQPDARFSLLFLSTLRLLSICSISVSSWSSFFSSLIFASSAAATSLRVASTGSLYAYGFSAPREPWKLPISPKCGSCPPCM